MKKWFVAVVMLALSTVVGNVFAYEGDVSPTTAYGMVQNEGAYILDVRTPQEWNWVGHPGPNKSGEGAALEGYVLNIAYEVYHEGYSKGDVLIVNSQFVKDVKRMLDKDAIIITMCRSGARSVKAANALTEAGFTHVYNMKTGFEGGQDSYGYRTVSGWKVDGLPYNYLGDDAYKD